MPYPILLEVIDLDGHGAFTAVWSIFTDLIKNVFDWLYNIQIRGVPLLYINIGFIITITLFAVLLPIIKNSGAWELNTRNSAQTADYINTKVAGRIRNKGRAPLTRPYNSRSLKP